MHAAMREQFRQIWNQLRRPRWFVLILVGLAILLIPYPFNTAAPADRYFRIEARRFEYMPAEISVNPGDRVTIELAAMDVVHGLSLDSYNISTTADPGQPARLTFVADRSGTFRFRCTVTCGALHPFMIGKLNVGTNNLWWRAAALAALAVVAGIWMKRT